MTVRILRPEEQGTWTGVQDRWAHQPAGFNRAAAEVVYKAIAGCPDDESARLVALTLLDGLIQHELITKGHRMAAAADELARARAEVLRKRLARQAIAKAGRREDTSTELAGLAVLAKAFDFTEEERQRYLRNRHRDLHSGRFVREHRTIDYDPRFEGLSDREAERAGIPETAAHLSPADRIRFQEAYHQIGQTIRPFLGMGNGALIHLHVHDAAGPKDTRLLEMPNKPGDPLRLADQLKAGEHVGAVSVSVVPPTTAGGAVFDALAPVSGTAAGIGYHTMTSGAGDTETLRGYGDKLAVRGEQEAFIPSRRVFRNIEASSKLLEDSLGAAAPPKLKLALKLGQHVGAYGPEAQRVIGPTADKAAYRYRGTERALPEPLHNAIAQLSTLEVKDKGWYLLHGNARQDGTLVPGGWSPSGVLAQFRALLPDRDLNDLHLKSGAVPPSRGVVFDKTGKASVLAVGYGDDHYLPFNLKGHSFRSMRGGEYIRTRTFGGPTTEDVYASLMGGARRFAVVSHNGVYTVDYAPDLKGGKRFNDNAARMVARYGYLLDAVRSSQVTTGGIAASRRAELEAKAELRYPEASHKEKHDEEYERLIAHETKHPELSQAQKDRAALEFFTQHADLGPGAGGMRQSMIASYVNTEASDRWLKDKAAQERTMAAYPESADRLPPIPSLEQRQAEVQDEISGLKLSEQAQRYAGVLNMGEAFAAHMKAAEATNKERLTPLSLNGAGYEKALQALQEEFPHYIADTQFHPWTESSRAGRPDTGYVRPRHSRAADALSGYFDRVLSEQGRGKVAADSTRYQNRNEKLRPYVAPEAKAGKSSTAAAKPDEGSHAALREDADFALFDAIKEQGEFSRSHKAFAGAGNPGQLGGLTVSAGLADPVGRPALEKVAPNLLNLHQMSRSDFEMAYRADADKMRRTLASAQQENEATGLLDIKPGASAAFARGGRPAPRKVLGEHASAHLNAAGEDYEFDDVPAYNPEMVPKAPQIDAEYNTNDLVQKLVKARALPERLDDPGFEAAAANLLGALKEQRNLLMSRLRNREVIPDEAWRLVDEPSEGLIRAQQLHRRHRRAAEAERESGALTPTSLETGPTHVETRFQYAPRQEWESPEDYAQAQAQLAFEQAKLIYGEEKAEDMRRREGPKGAIDA